MGIRSDIVASIFTSLVFPLGSILDSLGLTSPERRYGFDFRSECLEILIMDNRGEREKSDWKSFSDGIVDIINAEAGSALCDEAKSTMTSDGSLNLHHMFRNDSG